MTAQEPAAFRTILIASTLTVLVAGAAGAMLWWLTASPAPRSAAATRPSDEALAAVTLSAPDFAPGVTGGEREEIDRLLEEVVFREGPRDPGAGAAEESLVVHGAAALPRLLGAFHRLDAEDRFASTASRRRAALVDRMLRRIRRVLPPSPLPLGEPLSGEEPPPAVLRRAKGWFLWWERRTPPAEAR